MHTPTCSTWISNSSSPRGRLGTRTFLIPATAGAKVVEKLPCAYERVINGFLGGTGHVRNTSRRETNLVQPFLTGVPVAILGPNPGLWSNIRHLSLSRGVFNTLIVLSAKQSGRMFTVTRKSDPPVECKKLLFTKRLAWLWKNLSWDVT